jgi:hypothetical protein
MEKTSISLRLTPYVRNAFFSSMDVCIRISRLDVASGFELCRIQKETVRIPFCPMEPLQAYDELGYIPLTDTEESAYPIVYKKWMCGRDVSGAVTIEYSVYPRILPPGYTSSPYFDFRAEDGGANGAGLTFLANVPDAGGLLDLKWDLSHMPAGARGIWSYGEGDISREGEMSDFLHTYYAVGDIRSEVSGDYGFYWLSEPPFDLRELARQTRTLFVKMSGFFRDIRSVYRIFVRRDPFEKSGGGTALQRSYMFGYSNAAVPTPDKVRNLLAHEMVHNWPLMEDEPYGTCTWYSEGCAEYYSILLPVRFGLASREYLLNELQNRTDAYYTNPTRGMGNMEAAAICWEDRRAQKIAYGRGLFFLAETDTAIRRATNGEKSLDDVVLALLVRSGNGEKYGNDAFIGTVKEISGLDLAGRLRDMASGMPFAPPRDGFDGLLDYTEVNTLEADTGLPAITYKWFLREKA